MNYLKDLGEALKAMLAGFEENKQKEIIRYVQDKVLASYGNGIEAGNKPNRKFDRKGASSKPGGGGCSPPPFFLLEVMQSPTHPQFECKYN